MICIIALSLPDIFPHQIRQIINEISVCTFGVYLIHLTLGRYLKMISYLPYATLLFDLVVFVIATLITYILKKLVTKYTIV